MNSPATRIPAFQGVAEWVSENRWVLSALAAVIATTLVGAFIAWAASVWVANIALLANPITWIVLGIVALIAALVWLIANWDAVAAWLNTTWHNALAWAETALTDSGDNIRGFFASLPDRILAWLGDMGDLLYNAGRDVISGLLTGMHSMIPGLHSLLRWLTVIIPEWKGPPERDATLLEEAGRLVLGGFINGIEAERGALRSTLNGISDTVASHEFGVQRIGIGSAAAGGAAGGAIGAPVVNNYGVDAQELAMKTERTFREWQQGEAVAFR